MELRGAAGADVGVASARGRAGACVLNILRREPGMSGCKGADKSDEDVDYCIQKEPMERQKS